MPSGRFPGWRVVAGCFMIMLTNSGLAFYGLAVYLNAFSKERGWDISSISFATTLLFLIGGFSGVGVARLIARFDVRYVICAGGVIGGVSIAALGWVTEPWHLFVVYSVFAFGFAGAGIIPATTVVTRWFQRRRSVALSVASTGLSVGGIILTPLAKWMLDEYGLRAASPWLGLMYVVGTVPFALWLIRPNPEPLGWHPDGEPIQLGVLVPDPDGVPIEVAKRSRFFVATTIAYVFALGAQVGGIQQLVKLAEERTTAQTATLATLVLAVTSVVCRLIGGWLTEVMPMIRLAVVVAALQGVALVSLSMADTTIWLFASIALFGATIGNLLMLQPLLLARRFGVLDYAKIFSRSQLFTLVGTAGGPFLLGALHDVTGNYKLSYATAALLSISGAAVLAVAGPAEADG